MNTKLCNKPFHPLIYYFYLFIQQIFTENPFVSGTVLFILSGYKLVGETEIAPALKDVSFYLVVYPC